MTDGAPRHVVVLGTGGTVAATVTDDGAVPSLTTGDLIESAGVESVPQVRITAADLMSVDSSAMVPADQFRVVRAVREVLADPAVDGVVVTHGTDTMEETAYLADLYRTDSRPVVFTGAQVPADDPTRTPDGPGNIAAAIALAADPASGDRGVLIAMAGSVWPVRGAYKVSTTAVEAFDTVHPELGRPLLTSPVPTGRLARVDAHTLYPGIAPGLIAASVAQNAAGLVLAGTGSGNTHPDITAEVALARQRGVIVVVTTRVPHGPVTATYGGGGGAVDLVRAGAIVSPWLRAPQARMALVALLSAGADDAAVRDFVAASGPTVR
ncbi:asparaginase [Gordonia sinesedis]